MLRWSMFGGMTDEPAVAERFAALDPFLDERTRRLWAGAEARAIGRGGIEAVYRATRIARDTIRGGLRDLDGESLADSRRVRRPGGGRTAEVERDPGLLDDLRALVEADTLGDPESPLLWVSKSLRHLADGLRAQGHRANKNMVAGLLRTLGFSLQANAKTREGAQHPDRNAHLTISTSASWPRVTPASRSSAWTPRRRNWSASSKTAGASCVLRATRCACRRTTL